jgi:hypothetical protein
MQKKSEMRGNNGYKDACLRGKKGQVSELSKQWVLQCPPEKEKKRDSPYSLARSFSKSQIKKDKSLKEHSRIRLATIYSTHMHILI